MISNNFAASLLATASLLSTTIASPIFGPNVVPAVAAAPAPQLAVYWGQGPGQKRLADFCADTTMDIIPIGFVNIFPDQAGGPGNNYGNACGSPLWVSPSGQQTQMLTECSQIAEDIKTCQAAGKKIFASIGGAAPGGNLLASKASAVAFADFLWGSYGPLQDPTLKQFPRPFGTDTIVDGFDMDVESGPDSFYSDLVNELRAKFATSPGKKYYISAAPQCVVPDAHLDEAIQNSSIDYLFIQYYNTDQCSAASLFSTGTLNTNTDATFGWLNWLKANSQNKNIKIFLGLPASPAAAHPQDYLDINKAKSLIEEYACTEPYSDMFGGVMLFDATYSDDNTDTDLNGQSYAYNVKQIFGQLSCNKPPVVTTTWTTTWASTTTSTTTTTTTTTTTSPTTTTTTTTIIPSTTTTTIPSTTTTTTTTSPSTTTTTTTSTTTPTTPTTTTTTTTTTTVPAATSTSTSTTTSVYVHPTTTGSTTSALTSVTTSITTSTWTSPSGGFTSSTTSSSSSSSTTTNVPTSSSTSTSTTTSVYVHPTTSSSTTSAPTSLSTSTTTTTTTTYSHPVGGQTTSSISSSTTTYSHPVGGETTSSTTSPAVSTTSASYTWVDWTSTSSEPVEAATTSFATTSSYTWADWTSSSKPVDPASTSSVSTSSSDWTDWESSTTSAKPVDPATTTSSYVWADWTSSSTKPIDPVSTSSSSGWVDWESASTASYTTPLATAVMTQTVVPVKSTGAAAIEHPSGSISGYTGPSFVVSTAVKPTATPIAAASSPTAWTYSQGLPSTLTSVAAASATPASTGWLAQSNTAVAAASATPSSVVPLNVTPFTGGAAQNELPGTVLSVAVYVAFAVVGLIL